MTTWRLGLRAPLAAHSNEMKECMRHSIINRFLLQSLVNCACSKCIEVINSPFRYTGVAVRSRRTLIYFQKM